MLLFSQKGLPYGFEMLPLNNTKFRIPTKHQKFGGSALYNAFFYQKRGIFKKKLSKGSESLDMTSERLFEGDCRYVQPQQISAGVDGGLRPRAMNPITD